MILVTLRFTGPSPWVGLNQLGKHGGVKTAMTTLLVLIAGLCLGTAFYLKRLGWE